MKTEIYQAIYKNKKGVVHIIKGYKNIQKPQYLFSSDGEKTWKKVYKKDLKFLWVKK